jgi:hypothetical protein
MYLKIKQGLQYFPILRLANMSTDRPPKIQQSATLPSYHIGKPLQGQRCNGDNQG